MRGCIHGGKSLCLRGTVCRERGMDVSTDRGSINHTQRLCRSPVPDTATDERVTVMSEKSASTIFLLLACLTAGLQTSAVHAAEKSCGILQGRGREIDESPRFELLGA